MPQLTTYSFSRARAVADESSIERLGGHQVAFDLLTAGADGAKIVAPFTVVGRRVDGRIVPCARSFSISALTVASNVATATSTAHGLAVGDRITVAGSNLAYANGTVIVVSVADANTFTYAATGANATATGTITFRFAAMGIIETGANDKNLAEALTGNSVIVGGVLFETLLPDATGTPKALPAAYKAELAAVGCTFKYVVYADSRA
jgi:hypothetical protein